jgi:hypothetical protein
MQEYNGIESEGLNEEQERTTGALLNLIIPPSDDGRMPGAADVGFLSYLYKENLVSWIREGLINIIEESHNLYNQEFSALSLSEQRQLIDRLRRRHFRFFSQLATEVMKCYYQNDHVLKAIGLEPRPPFPIGHLVEDGDFTLLEPVYERGKIYRDA